MARSAVVFDILIASPSDLGEERMVLREAILEWNATHGKSRSCMLEPVMWETHSRPELGDRPQAILNRQIADACDAVLGAFWTRLGTPTGEAASGTVEELERHRELGNPVMLYFSSQPIRPAEVDPDQLAALREFKERCRGNGLLDEYGSAQELSKKLARGIPSLVDALLAKHPLRPGRSMEVVPASPAHLVELQRLERTWGMNARLGAQGMDANRDIIGNFREWYLNNYTTLPGPASAWEALGELANELLTLRINAGSDARSWFLGIGSALLAHAIVLIEQGKIVPAADYLSMSILGFLCSKTPMKHRAPASEIAEDVGASSEDVDVALSRLVELQLVNLQRYIKGKVDYGPTPLGLVSSIVNQAQSGLTQS